MEKSVLFNIRKFKFTTFLQQSLFSTAGKEQVSLKTLMIAQNPQTEEAR